MPWTSCPSPLKIRLLGVLGTNDCHLLMSIRRIPLYRDRGVSLGTILPLILAPSYGSSVESSSLPLWYLARLVLLYTGWCSSISPWLLHQHSCLRPSWVPEGYSAKCLSNLPLPCGIFTPSRCIPITCTFTTPTAGQR